MRQTALIFLVFIGLAATGGGLMLMLDPSGELMRISVDLLEPSPFNNYFIPGFILFSFLGIFSFIVTFMALRKNKNYPIFIIIQALIIIIWLSAELFFNIEFYYALYHIPLYSIALILIILGLQLRNRGAES